MVVLGTLAETPVLLSLGGETSGLSVLVHRVGDPVDSGVSSDGLVLRAAVRRARKEVSGETHSTRMTS